MALRLPPPPPPHPHSQHSSGGGGGSSGGSSSASYYNSNSSSNNRSSTSSSNNNGSTNSSNGGNAGGSYAYNDITMQSGLMFLVVGAFFVQMLGFFRQNCNSPGKKRLGYMDVADRGISSGSSPYRDNPLRNRKHPSSPKHPAIRNTPSQSINVETMKLLNSGGIRMMAHGVHCEPRRVWISIDDQSIIWQSEFQKDVPDMIGKQSVVAVRGSRHRIDWESIEYIDVGKRTDALKQATHVADHLCFSLLTPEGSLDLQTNSQLERDTLVSCLGIKLDEVHGGDWRQLYTTTNGGETLSEVPGSSSSGIISHSSFSTINQPYRALTLDV